MQFRLVDNFVNRSAEIAYVQLRRQIFLEIRGRSAGRWLFREIVISSAQAMLEPFPKEANSD